LQLKRNSSKITLQLSIAGVFAALVCITTIAFIVSVPATTGYFNVGEAIIYVAALIFGPYVGAFAGGLGAAIADVLVAPVFAPGTLLIKSFEGAIVGLLGKKLGTQVSSPNWKIYTSILGIVVGISLAITGSLYYSGHVELKLGFPTPETPTFAGFVPAELWYFIGGMAALFIILAGFRIEAEFGWAIFSVIIGGLEMVAGYFLYEQLILGQTTAVVEIPVNIGQMLIGLIVAIPVVKFVLRSLPQLKR